MGGRSNLGPLLWFEGSVIFFIMYSNNLLFMELCKIINVFCMNTGMTDM